MSACDCSDISISRTISKSLRNQLSRIRLPGQDSQITGMKILWLLCLIVMAWWLCSILGIEFHICFVFSKLLLNEHFAIVNQIKSKTS